MIMVITPWNELLLFILPSKCMRVGSLEEIISRTSSSMHNAPKVLTTSTRQVQYKCSGK